MNTIMMTPTRPRVMSEKITWAPKRNRSKSNDYIEPINLDDDDFYLTPKRLRYEDDKKTWAPKKKRLEIDFDEISEILKEQVDDISMSLKENIDTISSTLKQHIDTIMDGLKENIPPNKTNRKLFDDDE